LFHTVRVQLAERSYDIHIGRDIYSNLPDWISSSFPRCRHAVIVFDENVSHIEETVKANLVKCDFRLTAISVPSGEASKSMSQLQCVWQSMLEDHTDRGSLVVALGGGVIGDLAGFAAASYARGLPLVQLPTTLLSQVDSSVGGKTGINLPGAKNIVGSFWQPSLVAIDIASLDSLPRREFVSGLAEVVKYGLILLPELFDYLENNAAALLNKQIDVLTHIIQASCQAKADVVQRDERETTGLRAVLNYGHTFAHALENVLGYGHLLHGEAVAIGMHMAAILASNLGRIPSTLVERQEKLLHNLNLPTRYSGADPEQLWQVMQHDKKVEHGKLRFILPTKLGHVELVPAISWEQARDAMAAARS
jgi:3-dehydroquinate synthase